MHHRVTRTIARVASAALVAGAIAGAGFVGTVATAAPASASGGAASTVVSMTNAARASAGLRPYQYSADLAAVAQSWANQMAARGGISHNPQLQSAVRGWRYVGENVGSGGSLQAIQSSFMKSTSHRSNILDRDFTQVGVGVAVKHNTTCDCDIYYVAVDFRQPSSTSQARTSAAKSAPKAPARKAPVRKATAPKAPAKAPTAQTTPLASPTKPTPSSAPAPATPAAPTGPTTSTAAPTPTSPAPSTENRDPVTRALEFTAS